MLQSSTETRSGFPYMRVRRERTMASMTLSINLLLASRTSTVISMFSLVASQFLSSPSSPLAFDLSARMDETSSLTSESKFASSTPRYDNMSSTMALEEVRIIFSSYRNSKFRYQCSCARLATCKNVAKCTAQTLCFDNWLRSMSSDCAKEDTRHGQGTNIQTGLLVVVMSMCSIKDCTKGHCITVLTTLIGYC